MRRTPVGQIVAIDGRHDDMSQAEFGDRLPDALRLGRVQRAGQSLCARCRTRRPACRYRP